MTRPPIRSCCPQPCCGTSRRGWPALPRHWGWARRHGSRWQPVRARRSRSTSRSTVLGRMWAYSINARGGFERYIDADQYPVALAPLSGLYKPPETLSADHHANCIKSPENPGFESGPVGDSLPRHTPGTWTLGDIMGWAAFRLDGRGPDRYAALEQLISAAFEDGPVPRPTTRRLRGGPASLVGLARGHSGGSTARARCPRPQRIARSHGQAQPWAAGLTNRLQQYVFFFARCCCFFIIFLYLVIRCGYCCCLVIQGRDGFRFAHTGIDDVTVLTNVPV